MYDTAYLRKLAERYRKLARSFKHATIQQRLHALADELEENIRELQRPAHIARRYDRLN
jgi:hypothetical protein